MVAIVNQPDYEWQWNYLNRETKLFEITDSFYTKSERDNIINYFKFEPSKRLRKTK